MPNTALIPVSKIENDFYDWQARHDAKCVAAKNSNHKIVFVGDSITHLFEGHPGFSDRGDEVWREFYGKRKALNLGFGWDRTQNVLWRLSHGQFFGQEPKIVVVNIGTNNLGTTPNFTANSPAEVVEGIVAVCEEIRARSPKAWLLAMAPFPRDVPGSPLRRAVEAVGAGMKLALKGRKNCEVMDIAAKLTGPSGELLYMPDGVHPNAAGYRVWAEAIEPVVSRFLGPRVK